jgi:hypothetical protein
MPPNLQELVKQWVGDGRRTDPPTEDPESDAVFVYGGPGACFYLKPSGDVLRWDMWDGVGTTMDDGPAKVSVIVCAAQHRPELAAWLPVRPPHAHDCDSCDGRGWLRPPLPEIICSACSGLGWLLLEPD